MNSFTTMPDIVARMYYKYLKLLVPGYEFDLKTCDPNGKIIRVLDSSYMKKDINYQLAIDGEQSEDSRGTKYTNRYMMTPKSFYSLLMEIFLMIATFAIRSQLLKLINDINKYIHRDNNNEF